MVGNGWNKLKFAVNCRRPFSVAMSCVFFCFVCFVFCFHFARSSHFSKPPLHGQDRRVAARSLPKRWHGAAARTVRHQKEGNPMLGLETSGTWTRWPVPSEREKVDLWVDWKTEVPCESMYFIQKLGISRFYVIRSPEGKTKQQCFNR